MPNLLYHLSNGLRITPANKDFIRNWNVSYQINLVVYLGFLYAETTDEKWLTGF